jgi:hypothetical protein
MPDDLRRYAMLKQQTRQDRGGVGIHLERRSGLARIQEDLGKTAIGKAASGRPVSMTLELERKGTVVPSVGEALAICHIAALVKLSVSAL